MNIEIRFPKNDTQLYSICIGKGDRRRGGGGFTFSQIDRFLIILEDHENSEDPREVTYAIVIFSSGHFARKVLRKLRKIVDYFEL